MKNKTNRYIMFFNKGTQNYLLEDLNRSGRGDSYKMIRRNVSIDEYMKFIEYCGDKWLSCDEVCELNRKMNNN